MFFKDVVREYDYHCVAIGKFKSGLQRQSIESMAKMLIALFN